MMIKDDDKKAQRSIKEQFKRIKGQSKNNSSKSKSNQDSRTIKIKIQESREDLIKISTQKVFQNIE